ncbi:MAG: hypothetical protein Unbinned657contig1001_4 [Prokaryotic dsDNA virus sp.]|jgi:ribosomal protein S14|nr:MAG: hypothetical protein Unbinned657contig1001_4 [Prokaryotic dsDNA virus sp.]|tara:strand:+ start:189 stop:521 length:333 start_codon:yes stop_codon:yes gene_type:complete
MPRTKINNDLVVKYRDENPDITNAEISRIFGISRARVGQILTENNRPTRTKTNKQKYYCKRCGRGYASYKHYPVAWGMCRDCYMKLPKELRAKQRAEIGAKKYLQGIRSS